MNKVLDIDVGVKYIVGVVEINSTFFEFVAEQCKVMASLAIGNDLSDSTVNVFNPHYNCSTVFEERAI